MPRYRSPWEAGLAGLGEGLGQSLPQFAQARLQRSWAQQDQDRQAQRNIDLLRQRFRDTLAMQEAGSRMGTAGQQQDVFDFLTMPSAQQDLARQTMTDLTTGEPSGGLPNSAMTAAAISPEVPYSPGIGIPQTSDLLRELQTTRLLPKATPPWQMKWDYERAHPRTSGRAEPDFTTRVKRSIGNYRAAQPHSLMGTFPALDDNARMVIAHMLTLDLGRKLTPDEFATLKQLGAQPGVAEPESSP